MLRSVSVSVLATIVVPFGAIAQTVPAVNQLEPPGVTTVLPADTAGLILIKTTPAAWAEVNQFNPLSDSTLALLRLPFESEEFNFQQDVLPWLGDRAAIALLPSDAPDKNLVGNGVLLLPVTDTTRFNTFLTKLKTRWGKPQIERDYRGTTILQWVPPVPADTPKLVPDGAPAEAPSPQPSPAPQPKNLVPSQSLASSSKPPTDLEERLPDLKPLPPDPVDNELLGRGVAIALLPNSVAISNQPQPLELLVDTRLSGTSLAQNPLFQRTLKHPQFGQSIVTTYADVKGFVQYLGVIASTVPNSLLPLLLPSLEASLTKHYSTIDSHLWVQPQGLQSQSNFYYTMPQPNWATQSVENPGQILNRLPTATFLSANSRNFKRQWQSWAKGDSGDLGMQMLFGGIQSSVRSVTGLDVEKDLLPWLDGEYVLFLYPASETAFQLISPDFKLGLGLMLQTSDRAAAENALNKMSRHARSVTGGELKVVPRQVKGQPFVSWEGKTQGRNVSVFSYGWLDNNTLVITSGVGALAELAPRPYLPLDRNFTFKTATTSFPIPNEGYFYVNMGASLSFLYSIILPSLPYADTAIVQEAQRVLGSIRSLSSSNSATAEAARIDALWVLDRPRKK